MLSILSFKYLIKILNIPEQMSSLTPLHTIFHPEDRVIFLTIAIIYLYVIGC